MRMRRALSAVPICIRLSSRYRPTANTAKCALIANLLVASSEYSISECASATPSA